MATISEERLSEIEMIASDPSRAGTVPEYWLKHACETIRAAWAERDAYKKAKQENDERFQNERDAAREQVRQLDERLVTVARQRDEYAEECGDARCQVRQLREALETVLAKLETFSQGKCSIYGLRENLRTVLEATK